MSCDCYRAEKNFLGKIGVCYGIKEPGVCSCGGDEAKCDFYDYVRERAKKSVTNGDRIREMTDEELAEFLLYVWEDSEKKFLFLKNRNWLDWLREEVDDGY